MSEGGDGSFLWDSQAWDLSNSDNSGGGEEKSGKNIRLPGSSSKIGIKKQENKAKKRPQMCKSNGKGSAVNYIKTLQQTLQELQKEKLESLQGAMTFGYEPSLIAPQKQADSREAFLADKISSSNLAISAAQSLPSASRYDPVHFQTWTSSNVVLNICGDEAQISICSPKKPGLFAAICYVLEKHNVEVLSAHVSSDSNRSMHMIQAHASAGASDQFGETFPVEEVFKQVACEIMCRVSS